MELTMYSYFAETVREQGAAAAIEYAASHGFSSVELLEVVGGKRAPTFADVASAERARALLEARGMRCACYSVAADLVVPLVQSGDYTAVLEALCAHVPIAAALGSRFFHHTICLNLNREVYLSLPPLEKIFDRVLEALCRVADACRSAGLITLYEPQGYLANGLENFGRIYSEMKRRGYPMGVCGDFANVLFANEDPAAFARAYATEIRHVHVKDFATVAPDAVTRFKKFGTRAAGVQVAEFPLGEGGVDYGACFSALAAADYRGAWALECSYIDREAGFARDLAWMRSHLLV